MTLSNDPDKVMFAWRKIRGELSTSIESWHPLSTMPWRFSPRSKSHEVSQWNFATPASWSFTLRPKGNGRLRPFAHISLDSQVHALACLTQDGSLIERDANMAEFSLGNRLANEILRIPADEDPHGVHWAYLRQAAHTGRFYRPFPQSYPKFRRCIKAALLTMLRVKASSDDDEHDFSELANTVNSYSHTNYAKPVDRRQANEPIIYALKLDLKRFYPSIRQSFIQKEVFETFGQLDLVTFPDNRNDTVFPRMLELSKWGQEEQGRDCVDGGLPTGMLVSGAIANLILDQYVDQPIKELLESDRLKIKGQQTFVFFRYVDDLFIAATSIGVLARVVETLHGGLERLNTKMGAAANCIAINPEKCDPMVYDELRQLSETLGEALTPTASYHELMDRVPENHPDLKKALRSLKASAVSVLNLGTYVTTLTKRISKLGVDHLIILGQGERQARFDELMLLLEANIDEQEIRPSTRKLFAATRLVRLLGTSRFDEQGLTLRPAARRRVAAIRNQIADLEGITKDGREEDPAHRAKKLAQLQSDMKFLEAQQARLEDDSEKRKLRQVNRVKHAILKAIFDNPDSPRLYYPLLVAEFRFPGAPAASLLPSLLAALSYQKSAVHDNALFATTWRNLEESLLAKNCTPQELSRQQSELKDAWPFFVGGLRLSLYYTALNVVKQIADLANERASDPDQESYLAHFQRLSNPKLWMEGLGVDRDTWSQIVHVPERQALACLISALSHLNNQLRRRKKASRWQASRSILRLAEAYPEKGDPAREWPYIESDVEARRIKKLLMAAVSQEPVASNKFEDLDLALWLDDFAPSDMVPWRRDCVWLLLDKLSACPLAQLDDSKLEMFGALIRRALPRTLAKLGPEQRDQQLRRFRSVISNYFGDPWHPNGDTSSLDPLGIRLEIRGWARHTLSAPSHIGRPGTERESLPTILQHYGLDDRLKLLQDMMDSRIPGEWESRYLNEWNILVEDRHDTVRMAWNHAAPLLDESYAATADWNHKEDDGMRVMDRVPSQVESLAKLSVAILTGESISGTSLDAASGHQPFVESLLQVCGEAPPAITQILANVLSPIRHMYGIREQDKKLAKDHFVNQFGEPITRLEDFCNRIVQACRQSLAQEAIRVPTVTVGALAEQKRVMRVTIAQVGYDTSELLQPNKHPAGLRRPFQQPLSLREEIQHHIELALASAPHNQSDLVVFPELYLPNSLISPIKRWVQNNGVAVMGGTEYLCPHRPIGSKRVIVNRGVAIFPNRYRQPVPSWLRTSACFGFRKRFLAPDEQRILTSSALNPLTGSVWTIFDDPCLGLIGTAICFDFLSPGLLHTYQQHQVQSVVAMSLNKDHETFQHQASSVSQTVYSHVVYVNVDTYGGSTVLTPFYDRKWRPVFRAEGVEQSLVHTVSLDIDGLRQAQRGRGKLVNPAYKATPPGYGKSTTDPLRQRKVKVP